MESRIENKNKTKYTKGRSSEKPIPIASQLQEAEENLCTTVEQKEAENKSKSSIENKERYEGICDREEKKQDWLSN